MTPTETIGTLEIVKASWPILLAFSGVMFSMGGLFTMVRGQNEWLRSLKTTHESDVAALENTIEKVKSEQETAEEKLEAKLDSVAKETDRKLDQIHDKVNQANNLLAEIKGRFYSDSNRQS